MARASRDVEIINPGALEPEFAQCLQELEKGDVVSRIWARDGTVWKGDDKEISHRLGWLDAPAMEVDCVQDMEAFAAEARAEGLTRAVVLGMGGSSLAPEVFARMFFTAPGGLDLDVLDTTEPGAVAAAAARLDLRHTLFLVSSKSGSTAELVALLSFFYDRARRELGEDRAGGHFVAITDPGSPLEGLAGSLRFRRIFHGRPDIGGRFSALSAFGLLPAALKGLDLERLLGPAGRMAEACRAGSPSANPGALLGAALGAAARLGRDKLTFIAPPPLDLLAGWLEQLIAESTGKEGRGIVPLIESLPIKAGSGERDRLFVDLLSRPDVPAPEGIRALIDGGAPLVRSVFADPSMLGGCFFLWEFATAVAGHLLRINPFDQPDVESTKKKTREVLAAEGNSAVPFGPGSAPAPGRIRIVGMGSPADPAAALSRFLTARRDGDYLAVLAFLPKNAAVDERLAALQARLRAATRLPVTVAFGPRYLHSTGQLHKGDGNRGLFLMLVASGLPEVVIPEVAGIVRPAPDFASLFLAQAKGDAMALAEKGRRVLTVEVGCPVETGITALGSLLG
jgi:glucose-6-phosphate isomerase